MVEMVEMRNQMAESNENFRFFGNVKVGRDISVDDLRAMYSARFYAYGSSFEKKLGIEGEDDNMTNLVSGREFVGLYNGSLDSESERAKQVLEHLETSRNLVIIGYF